MNAGLAVAIIDLYQTFLDQAFIRDMSFWFELFFTHAIQILLNTAAQSI